MNEFLLWKLIRDDHILRENLCNMVSRSHLFQAFVLIFRTHTANMAGEETDETNADFNTDAETTGNPNASISTAEGGSWCCSEWLCGGVSYCYSAFGTKCRGDALKTDIDIQT